MSKEDISNYINPKLTPEQIEAAIAGAMENITVESFTKENLLTSSMFAALRTHAIHKLN